MNTSKFGLKISNYLIAAILVLLPFHALITVWLGSNFNHYDLFKIWKELLLLPLGLYCIYVLATDRPVRKTITKSWLFWLVLAYVVHSLVIGIWANNQGTVKQTALMYGLLINLRFVIFLGFTWIVALKSKWLYQNWQLILIGPALGVISFGILQLLVFPADFLRHFGYGTNTIPAVQTVNQEMSYRRLQSTLRGSNPLGAYLVLILTALTGTNLVRNGKKAFGWFLIAACGLVLFFSYSRSAYIGAILSIGFLFWILLPQIKPEIAWRKWMTIAGLVIVLLGCAGVFSLRNNDRVQNIFFHSSERPGAESSSNASRAQAIQDGLNDVVNDPRGRGPGSAGPASVRNHNVKIAENYYIQIGQEVGLLGLALFLGINIIVAWQLWRRRANLLALVLLASFIGITFVNLLSHAWTDDTISLIWWGFAGIALAQPLAQSAILNKRQTTNGQKTHKKKVKTS